MVYNLSTSPLSALIATGSNLMIYSAPLNPLLPLQDGTNTHIMATESSNYAQYRVSAATVRFRPLVPNSVGGYALSLSFWPQSTTTPTSVDMNSITATDVRLVLQPGLSGELVIPSERLHYRNQGWRSVETNAVGQEESTSGLLLLCLHGTPVNSFTNSPYSGALGLLDFALQIELRNLTPGNTNTRVSRYRSVARHMMKRGPGGAAQVTTASAMRFSKDAAFAGGNSSIGDVGRSIGLAIFNIADTLLGGLPSELLSAAGGQVFYTRPVQSANSEPTVRLYDSVENAQLDRPIIIPHDVDLGQSAISIQDYDNQHEQDRPTPSPAPQRPLTSLRHNDVLWLSLTDAEYTQSQTPQSSSPVYFSKQTTIVNVATGSLAVAQSTDWSKATIDGKPLPTVSSGSSHWYRIPLNGKISFWDPVSGKAGYPYNYNTIDSDSIYISAADGHVYISTYTTSLGTGPVSISAVGAVGAAPAVVRSDSVVDISQHTFDDFCPVCSKLALQGCAFQTTLEELKRLGAPTVSGRV
uniref:Pro-secreted protein ORF2 n=1 Tax=Hepatitis E virus TaxID=1678143 RepID=A0A1X9HYI6_HEV|nr:capsid protein [Hepatitis E virus]